jgi:hypothetical protein
MPKKKPPPPDEKPQRERFIEAAREAGVDETGEAFERAFAKIGRPPSGGPVGMLVHDRLWGHGPDGRRGRPQGHLGSWRLAGER